MKYLPLLLALVGMGAQAEDRCLVTAIRSLATVKEGRPLLLTELERRLGARLVRIEARCVSQPKCPTLWRTEDRTAVIRLISAGSERFLMIGADVERRATSSRDLSDLAEVVLLAAGASTADADVFVNHLLETDAAISMISAREGRAFIAMQMEIHGGVRGTVWVHFEIENR